MSLKKIEDIYVRRIIECTTFRRNKHVHILKIYKDIKNKLFIQFINCTDRALCKNNYNNHFRYISVVFFVHNEATLFLSKASQKGFGGVNAMTNEEVFLYIY